MPISNLRPTFLAIALLLCAKFVAFSNSYVDAGAPAPSRLWHADEYVTLNNVLSRNALPLPTLSKPEGAEIFHRLTSKENLKYHQNSSYPIKQRFRDYLTLLPTLNKMVALYTQASTEGDAMSGEIARINSFTLYAASLAIELTSEFASKLKRDETYDSMLEGLTEIRMGVISVYAGAEAALSNTEFYSEEDMKIIRTALQETLPKFTKVFPNDYRRELTLKFEQRLKNADNPEEKIQFKQILETLQE